MTCSRSIYQIFIRISGNTLDIPRKVARRNCFREEYDTGMRRYYSARKDSRPKPKKTKWGESAVFL